MKKTNELKKGDRVELRNGWLATLEDNLKGNIRMATVEGLVTETGSIYAHDILFYLEGNEWKRVEHTPAQLKCKQRVERFGFC